MRLRRVLAGARRRPQRTVTAWSSAVSATTGSAGNVVAELPFAQPSRLSMASATNADGTKKDVLAYLHTIPAWPEPDYTQWLIPSSQPSTGGKWRQRPWPVNDNAAPTAAQRLQYAKDDIAVAANIGIDGFAINILFGYLNGGATMTDYVLRYYDAAADFSATNNPGFTMAPHLSMLSFTNNAVTAVNAADNIRPLLAHSAAYKRDGKPIVCLYNVDNQPATWYRDFHDRMLTYGIDCAMIASHQAGSVTGGTLDTAAYKALFTDGIWVGLHAWNAPGYTVAPGSIHTDFRSWAAANGAPYCGGTGPSWENDRPDLQKQLEGYGVKVLQNQWTRNITANDPMVQVISWGDHIESHNIRPSTGYQYVPYDIMAYYIAWYKRGNANPPQITQDAIFYHHRMHLSTASYSTTSQTGGPYVITQGPAVDKVITTTFLTAPADITVTTGGVATTQTVAAGVQTQEWPFAAPDTFTFKAVRNGTTVVPQFSSAFPTRTGIVYQDLLYRMGGSNRPAIAAVQSTMPQDR